MAMEAYTSKYPDKIHTDLLSDARQTCYKARDAFYACLEKESNIKANEIAAVGLLYPVECKKTREFYEKVCRRTWVTHFERKYCTKKRALQTLLDDNESKKAAGVYV
ncbi:putative cytochrome c oxidase, subunit VIb [Helianthus anomalus]